MNPTVIDASPTYQPHAAGDAAELHAAGIRRAILKASEGATWPYVGSAEDGWYRPTRDAMRAAGIETETYHLTHAVDTVAAEVANLRRIVGADPGARIWVDAETTEGNAERMGTHLRELRDAIGKAFGVPVGRYDNRSTDGAVGPYDAGDTVWLAWPGYDGQELDDAAVVLVQTGRQQIGAETYDINIEITPAPANPAPEPQPAAPAGFVRFYTIDLRNAGHQLVTGHGVKLLQAGLYAAGYIPGAEVDGKGGPLTQAALAAFQSHHGLAVDAIAGVATWTALDAL